MNIPLYIHIPFCRAKCDYCDFYSIKYNRKLATRFISSIRGQVAGLRSEGLSFRTVYIGGGTPSVLDAALLRKLCKAIGLDDVKEVTLEANPESLTGQKLRLLSGCGVNRLSIGVQSFDDDTLRFLGRVHDKDQALEAAGLARKAGFKNISIDLIYGIPFTDWRIFKQQLTIAVRLPITHISIYSLTYEKGTPLFTRFKNKAFPAMPQEEEARIYNNSITFLEDQGFFQYEVSNFAKRGFECEHNLYYWKNAPYIGLGPSSVSYTGGVRRKYVDDLRSYLRKADRPSQKGLVVEREELTPLKRAKETAALNIRRKKGINFGQFRKDTGFDLLEIEGEALKRLTGQRLITFKKADGLAYGIRLTRIGFLFCDQVCREFL